MSPLKNEKGFNVTVSIFLIILASLCCSNSYNGDFVFDDSEAIINNKDVTSDTTIAELFQNDFWGTKISHKNSHKSYRPLTILTFRFQYWWRDSLDPQDFHVFNILLHSLVCILTYFIYQILLGWECPEVAYYAAILFAVHPLHTESVAGIVGRADVLSALFTWISIFCYYKCIYIENFLKKYFFLTICIVSAGMGMLCKETGITAIGICLLYDLIVVHKVLPIEDFGFSLLRPANFFREIRFYLKFRRQLLIRCTLLLISALILVLLRLRIMEFTSPTFKPIDNPASFVDSVVFRIVNYNYVYCLNAWLMVCPEWLCFDWSMGCVPLITDLDQRMLGVIVFWVILGLLVKVAIIGDDHKKSRQVAVALVILIVPFLPASNVFVSVGFVLAERTLYIPSAGFCLLVALGLKKLRNGSSSHPSNSIRSQIVLAIFYLVVAIFFARSWLRTEQWKQETTLFRSGEYICPLNAKIHYNVAKNAADRGDLELAKAKYREAIELNPAYAQALNNLGNLLKEEKNLKEAERLLRQAVTLQKDFAAAWMNLGIVLTSSGNFVEAEQCFMNALYCRHPYPDCYYNLGLLYLEQKNYSASLTAWDTCLKQDQSHRKAWINLVLLFDNTGRSEEALKAARVALEYNPRDPVIHFNIGNILGKRGEYEKAEYHFKTAIAEQNDNSMYYTNLGVLYHRWKKYDRAEVMYEKAIALNNSSSAQENLRKLQAVLNRIA